MLCIQKGEVKEYYDYSEIYQEMSYGDRIRFLEALYEEKQPVRLFCQCVEGQNIPIILARRENVEKRKVTYYLKRKNAEIIHAAGCTWEGMPPKSKDTWNTDNEGNIRVKVENFNYKAIKNNDRSTINDNPYSSRTPGQSLSTLRGFLIHLLNESWQRKIHIVYKKK